MSSTVDLNECINELLPILVGASIPILKNQYILAARHFCEATNWWRKIFREGNLVANRQFYQVQLEPHEQINKFLEVLYNNSPISPVFYKTSYEENVGYPTSYELQDSGIIKVYPIPLENSDNSLSGIVSLKPPLHATALDANLFDKWGQIIGYRVIWMMMNFPKQAYSNPNLAQVYGNLYDNGKRNAKIEVSYNNSLSSHSLLRVTSTGNMWQR